jgi:hypothetical protein
MRVLEETPGGPTIIQIEPNESILVFHEDGGHEALIASPDDDEDEDEDAKPSAVEITIALVALTDPMVRALIEEKFSDA